MERSNVRYEVLVGEDERVPAEPVTLTMVEPPPAYPGTNQHQASSDQVESAQNMKLPTYVEATSLPSYEEAERTKVHPDPEVGGESRPVLSDREVSRDIIGTDSMFLCAFVLAFFFNWIGLLFAICFFNTIAGRCGALSGLGLSIVKWVAIFKHNKWAEGYAQEDSFIWWLLMLCGLFVFLRGAIHYAKVKYDWHRSRQQRGYMFTL
ncbi:unnamed protein product [Mytilus coruscus]|uniref:Uncharacterized protein n=1 Tax=Mytilus coruscus TaxID=42192 RepID=A0A6J8AVK1_MYTCO|nr:unnamed protein product [Mytilus coruscus]